MTLGSLTDWAKDKARFQNVNDYATFSGEYLSFIQDGLQAVIISQNENHYQFFQYKKDGYFNVSRPLNSRLLFSAEEFTEAKEKFDYALRHIRDIGTEIDKVFIDKFLYNRLTGVSTPHFAVFLNDVQRKGQAPQFGIKSTFLSGHFKGYTIKLNPLDGVYYCDLRPNMLTDDILKAQIRPLDCLLVEDIWTFIA